MYRARWTATPRGRGAGGLGGCEGLEFIIDGVERPIQRPKNPERQRQFYSGKKKRHSIKNNLIIERRTRKIKGLSTTCEGKKHDKKLADEQALRFPKGSKLWKDTGFQGYEPEEVTTLQAKKKSKGGELSPEEMVRSGSLTPSRAPFRIILTENPPI